MKIVLLYKGYISSNQFKQLYRDVFERELGAIQFDILQLPYNNRKKVPADEIREWNTLASSTLNQYDYILISDSDWFKITTKNSKAETTLGMVQNSPNFTSKLFYIPSHLIYKHDPKKVIDGVECVLQGIIKNNQGLSTIIEPVINYEYYPKTVDEIKQALNKLHSKPQLAVDIEAKSIKVTEAGIYTIGFAWNKHEGIAFEVDCHTEPEKIKQLLRQFFDTYQGKLIAHKSNYDIPVLVYNLYQNQDLTDIPNQLLGINTLCKNLDDTLIITYLATNSCAGNTLGLKQLAQPYAGDWAVDITDVTKVDRQLLLKYNLVDCLSTWFVYDKYYPIMVTEEQEDYYKDFMLPTLRTNMRCQLNGLPIDLSLVQEFKTKLIAEQTELVEKLNNTKAVQYTTYLLADILMNKRNATLKKKKVTIDDCLKPFNFNSGDQLRQLLYETMQLPIIDLTDSKQPSTSKHTISKLVNHTTNEEYINILNWLVELADVNKISTAFVPAFEDSKIINKPLAKLLGYFNLGGTVSGRLSSSNINLN